MDKCSDPDLNNKQPCHCDHKLQGTGAVFFDSIGWLLCNNCKGIQKIRKSIWNPKNEQRIDPGK